MFTRGGGWCCIRKGRYCTLCRGGGFFPWVIVLNLKFEKEMAIVVSVDADCKQYWQWETFWQLSEFTWKKFSQTLCCSCGGVIKIWICLRGDSQHIQLDLLQTCKASHGMACLYQLMFIIGALSAFLPCRLRLRCCPSRACGTIQALSDRDIPLLDTG